MGRNRLIATDALTHAFIPVSAILYWTLNFRHWLNTKSTDSYPPHYEIFQNSNMTKSYKLLSAPLRLYALKCTLDSPASAFILVFTPFYVSAEGTFCGPDLEKESFHIFYCTTSWLFSQAITIYITNAEGT